MVHQVNLLFVTAATHIRMLVQILTIPPLIWLPTDAFGKAGEDGPNITVVCYCILGLIQFKGGRENS